MCFPPKKWGQLEGVISHQIEGHVNPYFANLFIKAHSHSYE